MTKEEFISQIKSQIDLKLNEWLENEDFSEYILKPEIVCAYAGHVCDWMAAYFFDQIPMDGPNPFEGENQI